MPIAPIVGAATQVNPAFWLSAANAAVRHECGWHVAPVITETVRLDAPSSSALMLRSMRVLDVAEVLLADVDVTAQVEWSQSGVLRLNRRGGWGDKLGAVSVTFRHGFELEDVPDVAALIATVARRGAADNGLVQSQTANGSSVAFFGGGGAPLSIPLLTIEKQILAPFKLNTGA